jgi:hypothetical protein
LIESNVEKAFWNTLWQCWLPRNIKHRTFEKETHTYYILCVCVCIYTCVFAYKCVKIFSKYIT